MHKEATILLPPVKSSPAQQYSPRQANSPRANVQFRDNVQPIYLRTIHKILIQADAKQVSPTLRVAKRDCKLFVKRATGSFCFRLEQAPLCTRHCSRFSNFLSRHSAIQMAQFMN
jgi:hypothetical protein